MKSRVINTETKCAAVQAQTKSGTQTNQDAPEEKLILHSLLMADYEQEHFPLENLI
jgi:hypothetical protein